MRQRNHPPLVILFDLLFMLLFVSVLNQERVLAIHLPPDYLPGDLKVLQGSDDRGLAKQALALAETAGFGFLLPCGDQIECRGRGPNARVALPAALYQEISQIATTPFADGLCRRLTFQIRANAAGSAALDYRRLRSDNPCLLKIEGMGAWLDGRQGAPN